MTIFRLICRFFHVFTVILLTLLFLLVLIPWENPLSNNGPHTNVISLLESLKHSTATRPNRGVIRRIHQTWKTHKLPPRFQLYSSSWKTCYPQWNYTLWDDLENREFIRVNYPWFLQTYDNFPENIYRADSIRYFLMFTFGGIYADLDTECLRPFEHLLTNQSAVFGGMEGDYITSYQGFYVQNSFFYSQPHHPFWLDVIREIMQIGGGIQAEYVTGPIMMTNLMNVLHHKYKNSWTVYPPNYFNPFSWLYNSHPIPKECKTLNEMNDTELVICREYFRQRPDTYVVQYHSQTWAMGIIR